MRRFLLIAFLLIPGFAQAQTLLPDFMQQYSNDLGIPIASGFVCTTISGTTTNLPTYPTAADAIAMTNPNANPVVLDSAGRGSIWLGPGTYRIVLSNRIGIGSGTCNGHATGSAIKTVDGIATVSVIGGGVPGGTNGQLQYNNAGSFGGFTMVGDCTFSQPNITCPLPTIAGRTYLGNNTGSSATAAAITVTQLTADLNTFSSTLQGVTPASGGGTANFLRADGSWAVPAGSGGGTVTTTGTPANGNLAKFSGGTSIVNGDLSGDCTTSGTLAINCTKTGGVAFAASATTNALNASNISSGTLGSARGGAGAVSGALKADGAGNVAQAACADLSNAAGGCTMTTSASTIASSATPTPAISSRAHFKVTALAIGATFAAPSGSPNDGDQLTIAVKDNGSSQTESFNAIYRVNSVLALPTATTPGKWQYLLFLYNSTDSKYDFLAFSDGY